LHVAAARVLVDPGRTHRLSAVKALQAQLGIRPGQVETRLARSYGISSLPAGSRPLAGAARQFALAMGLALPIWIGPWVTG
jgi:hypothetical protein